MSFLATRSGLTRTRVFELSARVKKLAELFIERHSRAVDEAWYARTVDWNLRSSETLGSTMITVPYNAYIRLIAKLRQRITQRHPAVNDTRLNCDPSLDGESELEEGSGAVGAPPASGPPPGGQSPTGEASSPGQASQLVEPMRGADGELAPADEAPAQDEATSSTETATETNSTAAPAGESGQPPQINYAEHSSFDFLDLLANISVHVSATQAIVANNGADQRAPVGVTGHLYDYATFARRFLNSTSLSISTLEGGGDEAVQKVQICPNGECPTKCGLRSDTIDCLLVDNNAYIVVGEELAHIGRSLADYDDKLLASLVEHKVYQQLVVADYQAICARNDQAELAARQAAATLQQQQQAAASAQSAQLQAAAAASSSASAASAPSLGQGAGSALERLSVQVLANFARALIYTTGTLYSALFLRSAVQPHEWWRSSEPQSLLGQLYQWQRSALLTADAQSAIANQSLLALLPNKTYLRPCEKQVTLYDMKPPIAGSESPIYYETKCGCSGWYVYDQVPETNLLMLLVNTSSSCRRCETPALQSVSLVPTALAPLVDTSLPPPAPQPVQTPSAAAAATPSAPRNPAEEQVCAMLEHDAQLYVSRPPSCLASHPDEKQITLCGGAGRSIGFPAWAPLVWLLACSLAVALLASNNISKENTNKQRS